MTMPFSLRYRSTYFDFTPSCRLRSFTLTVAIYPRRMHPKLSEFLPSIMHLSEIEFSASSPSELDALTNLGGP
jgi:hypothetical protein